MLRQKKDELLKIQQYVKQSLQDIHSKLNHSDQEDYVSRNNSTINTNQSRVKKDTAKSKLKNKKMSSKVTAKHSISKHSEKTYSISTKFKPNKKVPKTNKISKDFLEASKRIKRSKKQSKPKFQNSAVDTMQSTYRNHFKKEKSLNIMASFDNSVRTKLETSCSRQVTPAYKDTFVLNKHSDDSRNMSSQRRDRSTRNQQWKQKDSSGISQDVKDRYATPEHSRNGQFDKFK